MEARGGAMKKLWVVVGMPQLQELPYPGQSEYIYIYIIILICRWRVVKAKMKPSKNEAKDWEKPL